MDLSVIAGAYQGVKAVKDAISDLVDAKASVEARDKVAAIKDQLGGVQDTLFALRETLASLQDENGRLKAELSEVQSWTKREAQYQLSDTPGGAVVFRFVGQPEHLACPSCFNDKRVQVLQTNRNLAGTYTCPGCKSNYPVEQRKNADYSNLARLMAR